MTLDLSDSMRKIVRTAFPKANRVIDRFHIQKLACDAVQELRIKHRWDAIQQANEEMEEAKQKNEDYVPYRYSNGDTRRELLIRSRYLLSSQPINGQKDRNKGQQYFSKNILTLKGIWIVPFLEDDILKEYHKGCCTSGYGTMV